MGALMWWCAFVQRLKKEFLTRFYAQTYGMIKMFKALQ